MKKPKQKTLKSFEELASLISFKSEPYDSLIPMKDLLMEVGIVSKVKVTNIDSNYISLSQVVKEFTNREQAQQAFDKLNSNGKN